MQLMARLQIAYKFFMVAPYFFYSIVHVIRPDVWHNVKLEPRFHGHVIAWF